MSDHPKMIRSMTYQERLDEAEIEESFPKLRGNYKRTSDPTIDYNCLAWVVGNNKKWFDPQPFCAGYYWPKGIKREWNMETVLAVLALYGYTEEAITEALETGFSKIAIYASDLGNPTHFARQVDNGSWTSKAGELIDLEHVNLQCLEGEGYGTVVRILKKSTL